MTMIGMANGDSAGLEDKASNAEGYRRAEPCGHGEQSWRLCRRTNTKMYAPHLAARTA